MTAFLAWLEGKKTYIAAAITTVLGVLQSDKVLELGLIPETWQGWITLASMLTAGLTVASARSTIAKVEESQVDLANLQLRELDEEQAAELLKVTTRRIKVTAAKKPKPKGRS